MKQLVWTRHIETHWHDQSEISVPDGNFHVKFDEEPYYEEHLEAIPGKILRKTAKDVGERKNPTTVLSSKQCPTKRIAALESFAFHYVVLIQHQTRN